MTTGRILLTTTAAVAAVLASAGAVPAEPTHRAAPPRAGQAACDQPYAPWFAATTYPDTVTVPELGEPVNYTAGKPDTDGDGTADTIVDASNGGSYGKVTITRGDGVVTLTPGPNTYIYGDQYGPQIGDLDGDGRDELLVGVDQQGKQYVLPGTTTPGTHAIDDVGIATSTALQGAVPVGDQDDDGSNDLARSDSIDVTVLSGADILAPGPGGTLGPLTPLSSFPGTDVTAAVLDPGAEPTLITGTPTSDGVSLTVHAQPPVELEATGVFTEYTGGVGTIGVYRHDGATFVTQSASDRIGSSLAIWNLTDPCSRYVAPPATTTTTTASTEPPAGEPEATPATPVSGTAGYTG